jgi:hypothetical protein
MGRIPLGRNHSNSRAPFDALLTSTKLRKMRTFSISVSRLSSLLLLFGTASQSIRFHRELKCIPKQRLR